MIYLTEREMNLQGYHGAKVVEAARSKRHSITMRKRPMAGRIPAREYLLDDIVRFHDYLASLNPKASEITTAEACKRLKCSQDTVRSMIQRGTLKARSAGQKVFVDRYSVKLVKEGREIEKEITLADIITWKPWTKAITPELEACRG